MMGSKFAVCAKGSKFKIYPITFSSNLVRNYANQAKIKIWVHRSKLKNCKFPCNSLVIKSNQKN